MKRLFVTLCALSVFALAPLLIIGMPALVHAASDVSPWGVDDKDFSILMPDALVTKARVAQRVSALESAAAKGDANAAVLLGVARLYGLGVPKNESSAAQLIRQAALAGHPRGMGGWAAILGQGLAGVPANPTVARDWARRGAEAGNAVAMMNLAQALEQGTGGAVDRAAAAQWTRRSAELGNAWGMTGWGELLRNGRAASAGDAGLERNPAQAATWFRRAAESGVASAMNNLGLMLADGNGVTQNFDESERWLRAALDAGESYALGNLIHMFQRQVQAAKPDDGAKRVLLLRFTSSACAACRKADSAWNSPAFQDWLDARAKHLSIDIEKEAALAKKLGVTPEMMVETYKTDKEVFSSTQPLVLIDKNDQKPRMVRVSGENPQRSLETYLRESQYKSVWTDFKPNVPPELPGDADRLGRILDEAVQ